MAITTDTNLAEVLFRQGLLTQEQLDNVLDEHLNTSRKLARIIADGGFVTSEQISRALSRELELPLINLRAFNIDPELVRMLSETQARRFRAIALEDRGQSMLVGLADPTDQVAVDELARILRNDVDLAVVDEDVLLQTVDRIYRRTDEISGLARELESDIVEDEPDTQTVEVADEAPVVKLLNSVFEDAIQIKASDIHIEPQAHALYIRFRIDGVLHLQAEANIKVAPALVLRLKLMAGLDISEKRLPQDGRFNITARDQPIDIRMSTMPTQYGESVVMRLLIQAGSVMSLEKLGMPPGMLVKLRQFLQQPHGMILVTGPTGSGKTTTLYSALAEMNAEESKIITVEDPVEYRLPWINQVQVNDRIDLSFSRVLRSALRQDPDVIMVGEMRDQETAEIGLRAAMTGHLVLSTLHTTDASSTPLRLLDMGAPRFMVGASLRAVIAQRLVRLICESCSEPMSPEPHEAEWLATELGDKVAQFTFRNGRGCNHCNNTGYVGRTGIYELLEMTRELVDASVHSDPTEFVAVARQSMGQNTLRRHAVALAIKGRTTVSEAMRVSAMVYD